MSTRVCLTCYRGEIQIPVTNTMMTIASVASLLARKHIVTYRENISNITIYYNNEWIDPNLQLYHLVQNRRIDLSYSYN